MKIEPVQLQPSQQTNRWLWGLNALLAIGLLAMIGLKYQHDTSENTDDLVSNRTRQLHSKLQQKKSIEPTVNADAASKGQITLPFDWDAILQALEQVSLDGVIIDTMKIDAQTRQLALTLSFQSYDKIGQYVAALNQTKISLGCVLINADRTYTGNSQGKATVVCRV